jgi:hypothetical protein
VLAAAVLALGLGLAASAQEAKQPAKETAKPPDGWVEYNPKDRVFSVWIPKGGKRTERTGTVTVKGQAFRVNIFQLESDDKTVYFARTVLVKTNKGVRLNREAFTEAARDGLLKETKGKVADEMEVKRGTIPGKEYSITIGDKRAARLRVYTLGLVVHEFGVIGTVEQVKGKDADQFLDSYKLPNELAEEKSSESDAGLGGKTGLIGFSLGKKFEDPGAPGGRLIGFEVGLSKSVDKPTVIAVRGIYSADGKEVLGPQYGKAPEKPVVVKAKPGYAVGGLTGKGGLNVEGFSVTFMKVAGDALDPKDQYPSEWVGGMSGGKEKKLGGDGRPVTGLHGLESGPGDLAGLGLLLKPVAK